MKGLRMMVIMPNKILHILNAVEVLMTVWGGVSPDLRDNMRFSALSDIVKGTPNFCKKSLFGVQKTPK